MCKGPVYGPVYSAEEILIADKLALRIIESGKMLATFPIEDVVQNQMLIYNQKRVPDWSDWETMKKLIISRVVTFQAASIRTGSATSR